MSYEKFSYLYPPRAEFKTSRDKLAEFNEADYLAQPKYDGCAVVCFTNGEELHLYNRHRQIFTKPVSDSVDFKSLALTPGKWYVFAGEYLNKAKKGEHGNVEKDKYILWDLLVWESQYLIGETLQSRLTLLESAFPACRSRVGPDGLQTYEHILLTNLSGICKAPTYIGGFSQLFDQVTKVELYEGLVLKKASSKLEYGYNERNNIGWQIKIRKPNKLYQF